MMFHQECSVFSSVAIAAVQAKKLLSVRSSAGIIARIFGYSLHTGHYPVKFPWICILQRGNIHVLMTPQSFGLQTLGESLGPF